MIKQAALITAFLAFAGSAAADRAIGVEEAPQVVQDAIAQGALRCHEEQLLGTRLKSVTLCRFRNWEQLPELLLTDAGFTTYRQNNFFPATLEVGVGDTAGHY